MNEVASSDSRNDPLVHTGDAPAPSYNQNLTPLDPSQKALIRIHMGIRAMVLLIAAGAVEIALSFELPMISGLVIGLALLLSVAMVFLLPGRIYRRWGYDMGDEQLRVLRGFLWRTDTIVPFNRIQHIDVAQGPMQRLFELSTLIVHTAGTHNSIVTLPGLATADAEAMRETIKGHIRQDMI